MSDYIQGSKPGQYGYNLLNRKEEAEEIFVRNYDGTPERSIISAYKRFLENGLDMFLSYYGLSMFIYGKFAISIYSKKMKVDYDTEREYGDDKKFLIMEVDWYLDRSKFNVYNSFVDDDHDYIDFYMLDWEYLKNNPVDYYDINNDDYYHKIAAELKEMSQMKDQGTLIFCCELPIYESDEKIENMFEEKVMNRIDFFFNNLMDEEKSNGEDKSSYFGKINRNDLIKFRDEELARINARLLEFGRSR